MVVEIRFDKGVPHLQLEAAFRSCRGRLDPVMTILARTNRLILDGRIREGVLFLETAVLEIMKGKALDEQSFPLLLRLIVLYEESGIIQEECKEGLGAARKKDLTDLLTQAFVMAEEGKTVEPSLGVSSQLKREIDPLGKVRPRHFPRTERITMGEAAAIAGALLKKVESSASPEKVFSSRILKAFELDEEKMPWLQLRNRLLEIEREALLALDVSRGEALLQLPDKIREEYVDFLVVLGDVYNLTGEYESAREVFESVADLPAEAQNPNVIDGLRLALPKVLCHLAKQEADFSRLEAEETLPLPVRTVFDRLVPLLAIDEVVGVADELGEANAKAGKRLAGLLLIRVVQRSIEEQGTEAKREIKALLQEASGRNRELFFQPHVREAEAVGRKLLSALRQEAKPQRESEDRLALLDEKNAAAVRKIYPRASDAEKEMIRTRVAAFVAGLLDDVEKLKAALLFCSELSGLDAALDQTVAESFERALERPEFRREVAARLRQVKNVADAMAASEGEDKVIRFPVRRGRPAVDVSAGGSWTKGKVAEIGQAYQNMSRFVDPSDIPFYDFFFVQLKSLARIQEIHVELHATPAEPFSLSVYWLISLAKNVASSRLKENLLREVLRRDRANVEARSMLYGDLYAAGRKREAELILAGQADDPLMKMTRYVSRMAELIDLYAKEEKPKIRQEIRSSRSFLEEVYGFAVLLKEAKGSYACLRRHWITLLEYLALLYSYAADFEKARALYDEVLVETPGSRDVLKEKGGMLLREGKYAEIEQMYHAIKQSREKVPDYIYIFMIEVCLRTENYDRAEMFVTEATSENPGNVNLFLAWARISAILGKEERLERAMKVINFFSPDKEDQTNLNGQKLLIEAEKLHRLARRDEALDAFRRTIACFRKDGRLETWEIESQMRLVKALLEYAQADSAAGAHNGFHQMAKAELEDLTARYPYFAPAREMLEKSEIFEKGGR